MPADARPWLVFADDWGRHPSSCQHVVRHVLGRRPVVWANTIGTRPPRLDWSTAARVAGKLREWVVGTPGPPAEDPVPGPTVVAPKMWPSFASRLARSTNRRLLVRALRPVVDGLPRPPVVVTTLPIVADLIGRIPAAKWVYYCVDDFGTWPGYDGATMRAMERDLAAGVDIGIAVSETLQSHLAGLGRPAGLVTHGVDLAHWRADTTTPPAEFAGIPRPIALFWGVIDRRMDVSFVRAVTARMSAGSIVLVGPREDPDPALVHIDRVRIMPPVGFDRLPHLAAAADVLVMPYADIPATRAMQPLKLKEYLASGKPAVVRDLPATRPWADAADVCGSADVFAATVAERIAGGLPESQREARSRLAGESWAEKAREFERLVASES